jgi:5-methyltetrahydrofolate--homocysteine methyltransferase
MGVLGMTCLTIGAKASHVTQKLFEGGEYTKYLYLHGLSVETAEALAELTHKCVREELGIAGDDSTHIRDVPPEVPGITLLVRLSRLPNS